MERQYLLMDRHWKLQFIDNAQLLEIQKLGGGGGGLWDFGLILLRGEGVLGVIRKSRRVLFFVFYCIFFILHFLHKVWYQDTFGSYSI
jgi:hypothetical protein